MLFNPITLPNGAVLKNRLVKAAMEESLARPDRTPSDELIQLYRRWSEGGCALLLTGNVMVDGNHMTGAGNLVLDKDQQLERFTAWSAAAQSGGASVWLQINHPGRQAPSKLNDHSLAPSAINLDMGNFSKLFAPARAMNEAEINRVIEQFADTALQAERAGFDGVQIHAAHGYLISQFLSPLVNQRTDKWGGSVEKRAQLLISVVDAVRQRVQPGFAVAVKLNSADFQRGGFGPDDAQVVLQLLADKQITLIELSGGSYEAPAMQGQSRDERTLAREAYFLDFAEQLAHHTQIPLMTTGGIHRREIAEQVLAKGVDLVGMATALALQPDLPNLWQQGIGVQVSLKPVTWKNKTLASLAVMAQVRRLMEDLGQANVNMAKPRPYWWVVITDQLADARHVRRLKKWRRSL